MISLVSNQDAWNAARERRRPARAATALVFALVAAGMAAGQEGAEPPRMPDGLRFAHGLFRQRKYDMAAEEYARFLESDPRPPHGDDARFGLASARLLGGEYQGSREAFREFLDKAPDHPRARAAWYRVGELSYMLGDLPAAREALEKFTSDPADHPNLETAWTYLGDVRLALDDPAGARAAYERSLKRFPEARLADRARYGLARSLAATGEGPAALEVLDDLIRRESPDWVDKARLQVGKIELAAGRFEAAAEALAKVGPGPVQGEARLRRGQALTRLDRLDEAAELLAPIAADPAEQASVEAGLELAGIDLRRDRPEDALRTLEAVLPRAGGSALGPALLYRSAEALRALGRDEDARARFLKLATDHPADPWADDALLEAARLAEKAGDHDAAADAARKVIEADAGGKLVPAALLTLGKSEAAVGRHDAAVAALEKLIGDGSRPPDAAPEVVDAARYELAAAYSAVGKADRADAMLAALAGSKNIKTAADAAFLLGRSRLDAGRFAEAAAEFERALEAAPDGPLADHALANLAAARVAQDQLAEAAEAIGRLDAKSPGSPALPPARLRLAEALAGAGAWPGAVAQFRPLAESTDANLPADLKERAELGLARALAKQGDAAGAAKAFDAVLAREVDDSRAAALAYERARAVEASGDVAAALSAYEGVESRDPKADVALFAALDRARLLSKEKPKEAADVLGRLLESDEARARLEAAGQSVDAILADRGWDLLDAGEVAESDKVFARLLGEFPASPLAADARFNLAESANERKDYAEVVKLLAPMVDAAPDAPKLPERLAPGVLYRLARSRFELDDLPAAAATFDRLLAEAPQSPRAREARLLRAEVALRQDQFEAAEKLLAELIAAPGSPDDPPGLVDLARERRLQSLLGLRRWRDALDAADALKPTIADPAARDPVEFARGRALMGLGRLDEARAAFQAVIDSRKSGDLAAQAQLMRGETFFHEEQFLQALREFLQVDVLYPDAPRRRAAALLEAGKVYERLGRPEEAAETYQRIIADLPDDPHADEARDRREKIQAARGATP
ncbi:tetratricopeptide repeat protein [Paludisphaera sp.]|uniref:tetratricopeptide repeat protein n=1 Tax=Paludisphaera sp. TaxID=2017432 RepID=UPI00301B7F01